MICKKCGAEFDDGKFCPICGNEVVFSNAADDIEVVDDASKKEANNSDHEKLWCTFANIGYIVGIVAFIASFILPYIVLCFDVVVIASIVFSALGKKSISNREKAKKGLKFSIAALVLCVVLSIVYAIIFEVILIVVMTALGDNTTFATLSQPINCLIQGSESTMLLFIR